ncbi:MAG: glycosyltransferase, partial [Flavobacteriales bacterium]
LKKSDDEREYRPLELIEQFNLQDRCVVFNRFIPNEEVHLYFQCSDAAVLYYLTATPSGIESLSYNFKLPILATRVGHFPETIQDGFNGSLADAGNVDDMARVMLKYLENPLPGEHVAQSTESMSWDNYASAILNWRAE